jgi:hypothetical protein
MKECFNEYILEDSSHIEVLDPEDEGTMILQNVGDFYQSTLHNIETQLNLQHHHCDKAKSHKNNLFLS